MYQFKIGADEREYRAFLAENSYHSFMQLPEWAEVKDNWDREICAVYRDGKMVGGALLLIRRLPLGLKVIYSPRGFALDYSNKEMLKAFTDGIKKYAKSIRAIFIKLDPAVLKQEENMPDFGGSFDETVENLVSLGYRHRGFGKDLGDYFQPRFNMAIPLFNEDGAVDEKTLLKSFSKGARSYIGNYHKNRGITFECSEQYDDLSEFTALLSFTEQRQNIHLRNAEYFKKIMKAYGERAKIYYARIHLPTYIAYLEKAIAKGENEEKNKKLLDEAQSVMAERGETVSLSTGLVIFPRDEEKIKVAEYLYAGTDTTIFPNLSTPNGIVYASACDALKRGCDYYNLGGIDGDFKTPLAIFKKKFAPHVFEFVGEFDLIINKPLYIAFEKGLPEIKKIVKKLR